MQRRTRKGNALVFPARLSGPQPARQTPPEFLMIAPYLYDATQRVPKQDTGSRAGLPQLVRRFSLSMVWNCARCHGVRLRCGMCAHGGADDRSHRVTRLRLVQRVKVRMLERLRCVNALGWVELKHALMQPSQKERSWGSAEANSRQQWTRHAHCGLRRLGRTRRQKVDAGSV